MQWLYGKPKHIESRRDNNENTLDMDNVNDFFATLSSFLWGWPMIVLLLGTHVFLTVRLRFPQRKLFTAIRISVQRDKSQKGDVSQFGALATALAATIGTGNIIGVATAVALGGPGAVFWCWLTGVFGISTKYSEALLAIKYRVKSESGRMLGGPMYTLERGLGWRKMGMLFAVFTAIAAFGIGCTVQANAISTIMHASYGISTEMSGGVLMLLSAAVIIGGNRRFYMNLGVERRYNPFERKMETVPIISPAFKISNKVTVELPLGDLIEHLVEELVMKNNGHGPMMPRRR